MNNLNRLALITAFVVLATLNQSCNRTANENNTIEHVININEIKSKNELSFSQLLSDKFSFIPLETDSNILIGGITKASVINDYIVILDSWHSKSLYRFDRSGKFINKFGEYGKGPGQFHQPLDFTYDHESQILFVLDGLKVLSYDMDGNFLTSFELSKENFAAFHFEKTPAGFAFTVTRGAEFNLLLTNNRFDVLSHHFPFIHRDLDALGANTINRVSDSLVTYRRNLHDTIYKLSNKLTPYIYINTGNKLSITNSIANNISAVELINLQNSGSATIVLAYFENSTHVVLGVRIKGELHYLFYNKKSKNSTLLPLVGFTDDITFGKVIDIVGMSEDSFIIQIDPVRLLEGVKETKAHSYIIDHKVLEKVDHNSNPILLIANFNI